MDCVAFYMVAVMFLFPAGEEPQNPWKDKVPAALEHAVSTAGVGSRIKFFLICDTYAADIAQCMGSDFSVGIGAGQPRTYFHAGKVGP